MSRMATLTAACLAVLGAAATAQAATVTLNADSPANGQVYAAQDAPFQVPLGFTSDITGCGAPTASGQVVVTLDGKSLSSDNVTSAAPADTKVLRLAAATPRTYSWYARITCPALPGGELRSETRTFTVQGNPPRLEGSFRVTVHGTPQVWQLTPTCPTGACNTRMTRPGQKAAMLVFNPANATYSGRFAKQNVAPERICRIKTTLGGRTLRSRTHENVYSAINGRITITVRAMGSNADGTKALVSAFTGRQTAQYRFTPRGKRLGCPPGTRASAPLVGILR